VSSQIPEPTDIRGLPAEIGDTAAISGADAWTAAAATTEIWFEVVDRSPVALVLLDSSEANCGHIRYANRAASALLAGARHARRSAEVEVEVGVEAEAAPGGLPVSILEFLTDVDGSALTELIFDLRNAEESAMTGSAGPAPKQISVALLTGSRKEDRADGALSIHLGSGPDDSVIAQLVPTESSPAATTTVPLPTEALEQQQRFRSALMELSELADSTSDDDEFYQRLIERAVQVVPGAESGSVQLHVPGTASFRFVAASGFDLAGLQLRELEVDSFFRDAWDPTARIVRDFSAEGRSDDVTDWLETYGRLSEIVVNVSAPVLVDGLPVAFLSLDNFDDPDAFTDTSVEMTTVLSRLIGTLWRRRHLESELRQEREAFRHEAMHDSLTALPNRRNLERLMSDGLESARRRGHPSAVLFLDIDDFKGVNDRLGHEVGDLLLIGVAKALQEVVRLGDVVGRWGGDEFLVSPQRLESAAAAEALASRILAKFEEDLVLDSGVSYRARLTVGIGWSSDSTVEHGDLISTADAALYEAKAAGKGIARIRQV
jgi:diguanylate cyclase (GGDEF)-like protein